MILRKIALGNHDEAFAEDRFSEGLNIIFSNENNKGKTILIQSIMYSIGNAPIFPSGFSPANYYFFSQFEHHGHTIEFLRRGNSILVKESGLITIFDTIQDFKIFFNESIYRLPRFRKDGRSVSADLNLFFQVFYLPQDKRNTSNIINGGQFNKTDFISMVKSLINPNYSDVDLDEIVRLKERRKELLQNINLLSKRITFSRENPLVAQRVLQSATNKEFENQSANLQKINQQISEYKTKRSRENNRLFKLENLLHELNSLNRNIEIGKVKCADCGSEKIVYSNGDFTFEVSNDAVRKEVIASINKQIIAKKDAIYEYNAIISQLQSQLQDQLKALPVEAADIIISREAVMNERDNDQKIIDHSTELADCNRLIEQYESIKNDSAVDINERINSIIQMMCDYYNEIDEVENSNIDGLFTKNNENFSGSEEQIFYFSKLLSLAKHLPLDFPLIVDCFRDGEISTDKEVKMLAEYRKLKKQVLLTATLKDQEYVTQKYMPSNDLNPIDYSSVPSGHILGVAHVSHLQEILKSFKLEA
jgi:hypothetical protein